MNGFGNNPYRTVQVMDGDVLVGTVEYDSPGWVATILETNEAQWFARKAEARQWLIDERGELTLSNRLEQDLSIRYEWRGYD